MEPKVTQAKFETYNYTQSNLSTTCANDCSKVKVHELVRLLLQFICLGMDFSDHANQRITDLSFDTKAQTFNIQITIFKQIFKQIFYKLTKL